MRQPNLFPHVSARIALAAAVLLVSSAGSLPSLASSSKSPLKHTGIYESDSAHAESTAGSLSMSLGPDGSATLTQDCGKGAMTSFGRWTEAGSQVTVVFEAVEGRPAEPPMVFDSSHDGLTPVSWNRAAWGKLKPPSLKRESTSWHSKGSGHRGLL